MDWSHERATARRRFLAKYDDDEAEWYDSMIGLGTLDETQTAATLQDLRQVLELREGLAVLDAGAGTGALTAVLRRLPGVQLSALEPSASMLARLRAKPELADVRSVHGGTDHPEDHAHFAPASFDLIASRQVLNSLHDPLQAMRHWRRWLRPGGRVLVIEGLYDRAGWKGKLAEEVDALPLAANQSRALIPYLLETEGFQVEAVEFMPATNDLPATRTTRYMVVARAGATEEDGDE